MPANLIGGVGLLQTLCRLSGMSALTFVGAKRHQQANAAMPAASVATKDPLPAGQKARPLYRSSLERPGQFDFGDFQMLMVTMLAVAMYVIQKLHFRDCRGVPPRHYPAGCRHNHSGLVRTRTRGLSGQEGRRHLGSA
jgi:hypothetical protein